MRQTVKRRKGGKDSWFSLYTFNQSKGSVGRQRVSLCCKRKKEAKSKQAAGTHLRAPRGIGWLCKRWNNGAFPSFRWCSLKLSLAQPCAGKQVTLPEHWRIAFTKNGAGTTGEDERALERTPWRVTLVQHRVQDPGLLSLPIGTFTEMTWNFFLSNTNPGNKTITPSSHTSSGFCDCLQSQSGSGQVKAEPLCACCRVLICEPRSRSQQTLAILHAACSLQDSEKYLLLRAQCLIIQQSDRLAPVKRVYVEIWHAQAENGRSQRRRLTLPPAELPVALRRISAQVLVVGLELTGFFIMDGATAASLASSGWIYLLLDVCAVLSR